VEPDRRCPWERTYERAEPREGESGPILVEKPDRGGDTSFGISRRERRGGGVLPLGREWTLEALERHAVEQLRARVGPARGAGEACDLACVRQAREPGRRVEARDEGGSTRREVGMAKVLRPHCGRRVGRDALGGPPGPPRVVVAPRPRERQAEVQPDEGASGVRLRQRVELRDRPARPVGERDGDPRLKRVVAREQARGDGPSASVVEARRPPELPRLRVVPHAELVEDERRYSGTEPDRLSRRVRVAAPDQHRRAHDRAGGGDGGDGDDERDSGAGAHVADDSVAILLEPMPGYRDLLAHVKAEIHEIDAQSARELLEGSDAPLLVDVRRRDEWDEGHIPGAVHVPRGSLESRIEKAEPDRSRPVLVYCSAGERSAFAARTLGELGYEDVTSLAGGFTDWKRNGFPLQVDRALDSQRRTRYSRHLLIPEVGEEGQLKLLESKVLLIGAGGLGSPASLYLAAAGVGRLGIVDADVVDESNLQRQVVHGTGDLGTPKVDSARTAIEALNPDVDVVPFRERLTSENADRILGQGWDVIVDGADNFPTRYLVNDASVWHRIPVVHGSIYRFEGQTTVFKPGSGPCYRCLFPQPPPPELAPSCAEGGVLGVLPGVIGSLQANETLKLLLGIGEPLVGRLLLFDALAGEFNEVAIRRDPQCPVCGESPTITEYVDYVEFCSGVHA
jgi:sulfur-carrier protein adenylyltransferase/sulfurtransferase